MKKNKQVRSILAAALLISSISVFSWINCQVKKSTGGSGDIAEPKDPSPDTIANWAAVSSGLHASMGSIDHRYQKSSIPQLEPRSDWTGSAWRGENVSAQMVLWSKDPIRQVECTFSDFLDETGRILPARIARARFVRYVITDEFGDGCGNRAPENYAATLSPDILDNAQECDMKGKTSRPVWITLKVPADAQPGNYRSTMKLTALGQEPQSFEFDLEVLPRLLPPPKEWKFHLDLWQHPYSIAKVCDVELWSDEHWESMRPYAEMLADAGQKVITTSVNETPWANQTEYGFDSMIRWKKKTDGAWEYDYTVFDNYVRFMMNMGIDKQINCYSLIPWTAQLVYWDEATARNGAVKIEPGSKAFVEMWTPFLKDFHSHLEEKGWHQITNFAMDECDAEDMRKMLDLMDELAPDFGIALADNKKSYNLFPGHIKDLSVSFTSGSIDKEDLEYRKSRGYVSTYYVCCADEFPNTFTFSPPADAVYLGWYTTAAGFDGLLRWSFTSWVEDPLHDSRFQSWPAGDTYMVYPGARSSIRFERLVEGIQDAEKIRILRDTFEKDGTETGRSKLKRLNETVALFNILSRPQNADALLNHGKQILEELSR